MMKENYFKNIESKSNEFLSNIFLTPGYRRVSFDLKDSALLVIDMQNYFTDEESHAFIPATKTIIKPINKLISLFRENEKSIIFTRHINTVENANMLSKWWSDIITEGEMSEISNKFDIKNAKVLAKSQYDAFYQTELESYLISRGIKKVVITGVATHLCCETTARSAFVRGFEIFFPVDCTATYDESFHLAALRNLSHGFAHIVKSSDLIRQDKENE